MSKLEQRLAEDRQLRDSARAVLMADIEHARTSLSAKGMADRVGTRIGDGAVEVFELAKQKTGSNGGIIAALIGAIILWLGREPLIEAFERATQDLDTEENDTDASQEPLTTSEELDATDDGSHAPTPPASTGDNDEH